MKFMKQETEESSNVSNDEISYIPPNTEGFHDTSDIDKMVFSSINI